MGRWTAQVAVALEDKRFYLHPGVDPLAILRAVYMNQTKGKVSSGASTITSQVIRLSTPRRRTYANKAREFYQALLLEGFFSKQEILELYLNLAPFGGNIRGIEAASLAYFNKQAKYLSLGESTLLISLIRSPSQLRPDRYPLRAQSARDRNLNRLYLSKIISRETLAISESEPVYPLRFPFKQRARMATEQVVRHANPMPFLKRDDNGRLRSTIDTKIQTLTEKALQDALHGFPDRVTAAAVIIENDSGAVRAYVGNARHQTATPSRWVDCALAPRSPGSALKPFVYAKAIELGLITPGTLLADTPSQMQGASPRNFDRRYRGPVSARIALADSLNIPAVRILREVGFANTLDLYRQLGFEHFTHSASHYLDSLILGGCEVTALELARAYSTLAREGKSTPLKWTESSGDVRATQVLSSAAGFITLDILQDTRRLIPLYRKLFAENDLSVAFKTGTSYALRDAWTAAVTARYTLVLWFGDPTGDPHPRLIGLDVATNPALFIMRAIEPAQIKKFIQPKDVQTRSVCALSGLYPNRYCSLLVDDWFIPDVSSSESCIIHSATNGVPVLNWPKELQSWANPESTNKQATSLRILSPKNRESFFINNKNSRVTIRIDIESDADEYFLFLNGNFIGAQQKQSGLLSLGVGKYQLTVATSEGVESSASFEIRTMGVAIGEEIL